MESKSSRANPSLGMREYVETTINDALAMFGSGEVPPRSHVFVETTETGVQANLKRFQTSISHGLITVLQIDSTIHSSEPTLAGRLRDLPHALVPSPRRNEMEPARCFSHVCPTQSSKAGCAGTDGLFGLQPVLGAGSYSHEMAEATEVEKPGTLICNLGGQAHSLIAAHDLSRLAPVRVSLGHALPEPFELDVPMAAETRGISDAHNMLQVHDTIFFSRITLTPAANSRRPSSTKCTSPARWWHHSTNGPICSPC